MLIDNPDAFNLWLTAVLEPLCDADPAALAKYIYALVKKDKPLDDLRDGMLDQLDVFLQHETKPFVELLFKSLESREYLKPLKPDQPHEKHQPASPVSLEKTVKPSNENHDHNNLVTKPVFADNIRDDKPEVLSIRSDQKDPLSAKEKESESRARHNDSSKKDVSAKHRIVLNRTTKFVPATVPKEKPAYATEQTLVKVIPDLLEDSLNEQLPIRNSRRDRKSDSDKEDRRRRQYRSRSRSRSWDRNRRPPSGGRALWRNRSPPLLSRYERRRSRSGSPPVRIPRYRNRSPPPGTEADIPPSRSRSRSRERAMSPVPNPPRERLDGVNRERDRDRQSRNRDRVDRDKGDRDRERLDRDRDRERDERRGRDSVSGTATPTQDSNPGDSGNQPRGTTTLAGIFAPTQKKRCRDFDEKGFCMRGDLCQFDHGIDPVVLEDSSLLALPMARPPPRLPAPAPDIWARGGLYAAPPPAFFPFIHGPAHGHHPVQRELIPIPTVRMENMPPNGTSVPPPALAPMRGPAPNSVPLAPVVPANNHIAHQPPMHLGKKKPFDFTRLGPNRHHMNKTPGGNCSLELKKVPSGLNDIMHLNNHFSKFGKIVNIQVCYEDDPEAALITFSSHTEANVAYKSTEAVLNNRFIKVFWHNSESKQENVPPGQRTSAKDRLMCNHSHVNNNNVNHVSHNKVLINKDSSKVNNNSTENKPAKKEATDAATENNKNGDVTSTVGKDQPSVTSSEQTKIEVPATQELAAMVKKRGESGAKIVKDLRRRLQQLLDKQLQHQRLLLERLETLSGAQKDSLITTIKAVQKGIECTRKELVTNLNPKSSNLQLEDSYVVNSMRKMSLSTQNSLQTMMKKAGFGHLKKVPRSKEEAQKEILDAELDLITKQQEGQDVSELQKRVAELRRQQYALKTSTPARRIPMNRISTRGRFPKTTTSGKAGLFVNQSVDHRPRSFLVSGYEADELDLLMQHFTQYGEIVDSHTDPTTPSLWLQFKSRKVAEQAATKGRQFNDRTLTVTWQQKTIQSALQPQIDKSAATENINPMEKQAIYGSVSPTYSTFVPDAWPQKNKAPVSQSENAATGDVSNTEDILLASPKQDWDYTLIPSPSFNLSYPDSEDDEGKDDEKEEDRSWRR
ncbi:zinc finger protein swm isoform X2 [Arctopsyche grandis]|uniref:zinc finger protein swm isoform X2 n=1 Tax=Arctopsyche grandis TaxID=121162 RepID=UPI00406D7091